MKTQIYSFWRRGATALAVIAVAIALLPMAGRAQTTQTNIVVWQDNFDAATLGSSSASTPGSYGAVSWNFQGAGVGNPAITITNDLVNGTNTQNCAITFTTTPGTILNFGLRLPRLAAVGNTNTALSAYTLNFDIAIQGVNISQLGGYIGPSLGLFGKTGSGLYAGDGLLTNVPVSFFPAAGTGYQHVSMPLASFVAAYATLMPATDTPISFFLGFYMGGPTYSGTEEIDLANVQLVMNTKPPVIPPPTLSIIPAQPALRVFAQNSAAVYNQEGFGTVDNNQSWVGIATPSNPVSYSINFKDFDTANGYALYAQFIPSGGAVNPYVVYFATNALVWTITHQSAGFTSTVTWKTNSPAAGEPNTPLSLTTTSKNGRGIWTLTFTGDTVGTVTGPDGTTGSFSLPPEVPPLLGNPMSIMFGTAPNTSAGYGQFIDIAGIAVTNILGAQELDNFTQDAAFNTGVWNPAFSLDAGSVVLVSSDTPYWVTWTVPDLQFGLETISSLNGGGGVWNSPDYYGAAYGVLNTTPTLMGGSRKWTLIPTECLPTMDGSSGGVITNSAFFRLSNPPPAQ